MNATMGGSATRLQQADAGVFDRLHRQGGRRPDHGNGDADRKRGYDQVDDEAPRQGLPTLAQRQLAFDEKQDQERAGDRDAGVDGIHCGRLGLPRPDSWEGSLRGGR